MRLLVVEDEPNVASALKAGLEADGFVVDLALDGSDGLAMAQTSAYAAIVLDIMLPGLNGYRFCRQLRAEDNWTPIMILSAKVGHFDQIEALEIGADDYLTKPFAYDMLLARLRALIRRAEREGPSGTVEVGDLRLDQMTRRCWRGAEEIALSPRALAVLEFLMRNAGNVVSKSEILSGVWDANFDGDPNIVEVYVSRLRQAVDVRFGRSSLQTVRGAGYRLVADPA
ncbi:MAG: response regulator transcription factor [Acidimicrobiia bacterium]|nr:response regulator transcription factor [Acidimicrobiia bacterium]